MNENEDQVKEKFKSRTICSVPQCRNRASLDKRISLHLFPKNKSLKKQWMTLLRIAKLPKFAYCCSDHFDENDFRKSKTGIVKVRRLKSNALPSKKIPKRFSYKSPSTPKKQKIKFRNERFIRRQLLKEFSDENKKFNKENISDNSFNLLAPINQSLFDNNPKEPVAVDFNGVNMEVENILFDKEIQVETITPNMTVFDKIFNDKGIFAFTGLKSVTSFQKICEAANYLLKELKIIDKSFLDLSEKICLTLTKLKTNLTFKCLAVLFGISLNTCISHFFWTIDLLYTVLRQFVIWPTSEVIKKNIPKHFEEFLHTRVVLDCTEMKVSKSSCIQCRLRTYSHYKSTFTVKAMIGMAPYGVITFISDLYGGRASDKTIFNNSKIIEKCDLGDGIMTDKGFLIDKECSENNIHLIRPPFLSSRGIFTEDEASRNKHIARARVHVERIIQRIKLYKIINERLDWMFLNSIDKIITIICALVNISSPILKDESFV